MIIRPFEPADREAVIKVWRAAGLVRSGEDPERSLDRKLAFDPAGVLIAVDEGHVVGTVMVGYEGRRGWINALGVLPDRQGEGIGKALVEAAVERLRALGCPKVNLQVRRSNEGVVAFYQGLGFVEDDVRSMGLRLGD